MKNTYSDSAQLRVADQGVSAIIAFIEELSLASQEKALIARAPIPGFRKGSPAFFKKQKELLAAAIGHASNESRRPKDTDWMAFSTIWSLWGRQKFPGVFPSGPFNFADFSTDESLDFVRKLVEDSKSGCAREDIDRLVLFSGLPTTDALQSFIARLPLKVNLERDKALAKLPEEVGALRHKAGEIEKNVGKLADELKAIVGGIEKAERNAQKSAAATVALQGQFSDYEKRLSASSSKDLQIVVEKLSVCSKQVDALRKDHEDTKRALDIELGKKHQSLQNRFNALTEEVSDVRANIDAIVKSQQELLDSLKTGHLTKNGFVPVDGASERNSGELHLQSTTAWVVLGQGNKAKDLARIESLFKLTQDNLIASCVRQSDADRVARTVVSAMISGQLLQCSGSLADVLGTAAAASCGGEQVLSWQVPLGLKSTSEADSVQRIAESGAAGALMLKGINRSAFEIYGSGIRDTIVRRHFQREEGREQLGLIATYAEGPATLPINTSLVELGPLVDTDTLKWDERANWHGMELGKSVVEVKNFRSPLSFRDEIDEIHRLINALETPTTKLWHIVFSKFVNVLFLLPDADFNNCVSTALHAWVLPLAKVKGLGRERVEDAIRTCAIEQLNFSDIRKALDDLPTERGA